MIENSVLASINLFCVLRNLEDLVDLDERAKKIIADIDKTIKFNIPFMPEMYLKIKDNKIICVRDMKIYSDINLNFLNPTHLNLMIKGKSIPLPSRGFKELNFLTNEFKELTDILGEYLKPEKEKLLDREFNHISTTLSFYTAFFSVSEIANNDKLGIEIAKKMKNGVIKISIDNGPKITIRINNSIFKTTIEDSLDAVAFMDFDSLDTAGKILRSEIDAFTAIGSGKLAVSGRIPLIDNLNKLLRLVSIYLE